MGRLFIPGCIVVAFLTAGMGQDNDTVFYHGTVMRIAANAMVVSEYDYEQSKQIEMTYTLDPKVTTEYVESVKDIKPGNAVGFYYVNRKGKYTIFKVIVYEEPGVHSGEPAPAKLPAPDPAKEVGP